MWYDFHTLKSTHCPIKTLSLPLAPTWMCDAIGVFMHLVPMASIRGNIALYPCQLGPGKSVRRALVSVCSYSSRVKESSLNTKKSKWWLVGRSQCGGPKRWAAKPLFLCCVGRFCLVLWAHALSNCPLTPHQEAADDGRPRTTGRLWHRGAS